MSRNTARRFCYGCAIIAAAIWWPFIGFGAVVLAADYFTEG
jgi:hypothetical protein